MCTYMYENTREFRAEEPELNEHDAACKFMCMQGGMRFCVWAFCVWGGVCAICTKEPKLDEEDGAHKLVCGWERVKEERSVCVCVCVCEICTYIYIIMYICIWGGLVKCVYIYACMHTIFINRYVQKYMYIYVCIWIIIYICAYICVYIWLYINIRTGTRIHMCM